MEHENVIQNKQVNSDEELYDFSCSICQSVLILPVKLECNHYYCFNCIIVWFEQKNSCPLCNYNIPLYFRFDIDKEKQKEIEQKYSDKYDKKFEEEQQKKYDIFSENIPIVIEYGNTHEIKESENNNKHKWQLSIKVYPQEYNPSLFIRKAYFKNHPTFSQVECLFNKQLKSKTYVGWGVFDIPITIKWQFWLHKNDKKIFHSLSFENTDNFNRFVFYVNKKDLESKLSLNNFNNQIQ